MIIDVGFDCSDEIKAVVERRSKLLCRLVYGASFYSENIKTADSSQKLMNPINNITIILNDQFISTEPWKKRTCIN